VLGSGRGDIDAYLPDRGLADTGQIVCVASMGLHLLEILSRSCEKAVPRRKTRGFQYGGADARGRGTGFTVNRCDPVIGKPSGNLREEVIPCEVDVFWQSSR